MNRTFAFSVALAALVLLAPVSGCLGGTFDAGTDATTGTTVSTSTATTDEPTITTSGTTRGSYRSVRIAAERVTPADLVEDRSATVDEVDPEARPTVRRLLNRSNHTVETTHLGHDGHLSDGAYVRSGERFYRIERTVTDTREVDVHEFELSGPIRDDGDEYATARSEAVAFEDLPEVDREAFLAGLPPDEDRRRAAHFTAGYQYRFENGTVPDDTVVADGDVHYVEYRGEYYRIDRGDDERSTRYHLEYEAVPVAESPDEFAPLLVDRLVVNVSTVATDEAERSLLLAAIGGTEQRWEGTSGEVPANYSGLRERIGTLPPENWVAYVRHDGDLYRVRVTVVVS